MNKNVPNMLTILRVLLVPVFVILTMYDIIPAPYRYLVCAIVFTVTALTDMLDGKIARKYNLITNFGKFMDALADKFMVYSAYLVLVVIDGGTTLMSRLIVWLTVVIFLRDLAINGIRMLAASSSEKVVVAAQWSGKVKTTMQSVSVVVILMEKFFSAVIFKEFFSLGILSYVSIVLTLAITLWSGIDYVYSYRKFLKFN